MTNSPTQTVSPLAPRPTPEDCGSDIQQQPWQQILSQLQTKESACVVVDMSLIGSLDRSGLNSLVSTAQLAQRLNKCLMLCSVPPSVKMVLEITQLDRVLPLVESSPTQ